MAHHPFTASLRGSRALLGHPAFFAAIHATIERIESEARADLASNAKKDVGGKKWRNTQFGNSMVDLFTLVKSIFLAASPPSSTAVSGGSGVSSAATVVVDDTSSIICLLERIARVMMDAYPPPEKKKKMRKRGGDGDVIAEGAAAAEAKKEVAVAIPRAWLRTTFAPNKLAPLFIKIMSSTAAATFVGQNVKCLEAMYCLHVSTELLSFSLRN